MKSLQPAEDCNHYMADRIDPSQHSHHKLLDPHAYFETYDLTLCQVPNNVYGYSYLRRRMKGDQPSPTIHDNREKSHGNNTFMPTFLADFCTHEVDLLILAKTLFSYLVRIYLLLIICTL